MVVVCQVLASQVECEIVKEMPLLGKDVVCLENVTTEKMNIVENNVSVLKLGSGPVLNKKKSLRSPGKMEDPERRNISCFVRNVDKGNLFVLKVELIPFLRTFACLETLQTKIDFSCLIWLKAPQDLRF